jgi:hypothetical protein
MSRSGTKKTRAQAPLPPPQVTDVNPTLTGKVSPIRWFGSFYQIGTILFVLKRKAFSFSSYLDSWAGETGIVILGRVVQAQLMYLRYANQLHPGI